MLVRPIRRTTALAAAVGATLLLAGCSLGSVGAPSAIDTKHDGPSNGKRYRIAMVPKFTSDPYFQAAHRGAEQAARELGVDLAYNGPVDADVSKQADIVEQFAQQRFDAITVSANDPNAIVPAMQRARRQGIETSTFDADAGVAARGVFLNQATFRAMGRTMVDMMVRDAGTTEGDFLVVTGVLTAPNQSHWIDEMRKYIAQRYPKMRITAVLAGNEDLAKSRQVALDYLRSHPATKGVWCVTGIATPGVAEAVKQLGRAGRIAVTGLGVPSLIRRYVKDGTVKEATLWNPTDIGYAAVYMAKAQIDGTLDPRSGGLRAGRLGRLRFTAPDTLLLGPPLVFDRRNIDDYRF